MKSLWMSFSRQTWPLNRYSLSPSRWTRRVISISWKSLPSCFSHSVRSIDTSHSWEGLRVSAPSKMTSCIFPPRSAFGLCSPRTQRIASAMLDFPQPFGPTTAVTPGSNDRGRGSANHLKPWSLSVFRCIKPTKGREPRNRGQTQKAASRVVPGKPDVDPPALPHAEHLEHLARIEDSAGVERALHRLHRPDRRGRMLEPEERRLGEADPVLARDRPAAADDHPHQLEDRARRRAAFRGIRAVVHDVDVEVPVPQVAERGDGQAGRLSHALEEAGESNVVAHRNDDVLVQLRVAKLEHGGRAFAPDLPEPRRLAPVPRRPVREPGPLRPPPSGRPAGPSQEDRGPPRLAPEHGPSRRSLRAFDRVAVEELADRG